jgi:hypothetical protein
MTPPNRFCISSLSWSFSSADFPTVRSAEHTLDCNDGQGRRRRETGNFKFTRPAYLLHAANALYMAIFQQSKRIAIA